MATIEQKVKQAAARKRLRKIEREVTLIAAGAGYWWLADDNYFEQQDDTERCLGNWLEGIRFHFDLPTDAAIFRPWNLHKFNNPRNAAKAVIEAVDYQKLVEKQEKEQSIS